MLLGSTVVLSRRFDPERVLPRSSSTARPRSSSCPVHARGLLAADRVALRHLVAAGHRLAAAARCPATSSQRVHERVRAGAAQPLRLDRGRVRRRRHAGGPRRRPAHGRPAAARRDAAGRRRATAGTCRRATPGRVFVGSGLTFAGYTDGTDKDRLDGLVATGDLGVLDAAGRLTVLGRDDDMVVVGGENVYTGAGRGRPRRAPVGRGGGGRRRADDPAYGARLVAHVVPAPGRRSTPSTCRRWCAARSPGTPCRAEVRVVDELPRNATGKVLHRELRAGGAPMTAPAELDRPEVDDGTTPGPPVGRHRLERPGQPHELRDARAHGAVRLPAGEGRGE